ncbi:heliorhodopsin HeR [Micromonospora maritima]|uniref:heliorhodopsin HeR n=1 Tax=Micromonospora maritima TaxID=986711 RepID=UPI00157E24F4|nr:heliorhodopsin HeR [Micromonospora maritima]
MGQHAELGGNRYRRLRAVNVLVGALLAAEGIWMWAASNDLSLPVTASYLTADPVTLRDATVPEVAFRVAVGPAVAVFLLLAAVDHFVTAAPGVHRWYERNLDRRANYARWIEYSVSASIMIVLIGLFVGIRDLAAVIGIFAANTAMILFGLLMERQQTPGRADWSAFWFGSLVGAAPWLAIAVYVAQPPEIPGFVWAIIIVQFLLFASFAVNMALQYARRGRWRDYRYGEVSYIVLSLAAKSALAWLIYANVLRS